MTDKKGDDYVKGLVGDSLDGMMGKKKPKKTTTTYTGGGYGSGYGSGGYGSGYRGGYGGGYTPPRRYGWDDGDDIAPGRRPAVSLSATEARRNRMATAANKALQNSEWVQAIRFDSEGAYYDEQDIRDMAAGVVAVMLECAENAELTVRSGANTTLMQDMVAQMFMDNFVRLSGGGRQVPVAVGRDGRVVSFVDDDTVEVIEVDEGDTIHEPECEECAGDVIGGWCTVCGLVQPSKVDE